MFRLMIGCAGALLLLTTSLHAQEAVFSDDFDRATLNSQKWVFGKHAGNLSAIENGEMHLRSSGRTSGWMHTREKFSLQNRIVQIKVAQPNGDGALGISPTANSASAIAFSEEPNSYRFYTYRSSPDSPYKLFVRWSKNRQVGGREVAEDVTLSGVCYLRMRLTSETIHFEYSFDGEVWETAYAEIFSLPNLKPADPYYVELAADYTEVNGEWVVDDFAIQNAGAATTVREQIVLDDPLQNNTLGARSGGQFTGNGWKVTGPEDMIVYDLGRYIENGALTIQLNNFKPGEQNAVERHHVLSMFRNPWGDHNIVENQETLWDLHTGFNYKPGVKMLSFTDNFNEQSTIVWDDWELERTYYVTVIWQGKQLQYFRNGKLAATHTHASPMQLRYLFLGRDRTVSGDFQTNFKGNQYPSMIGPVYSNLIVKEFLPPEKSLPPAPAEIVTQSIYANAARLRWSTNAPAICYVEYGTTAAFGNQTAILGPPAQTFSTTLAGLAPNQSYHYRIVALDEEGNRSVSTKQTFTTLANSLYLFKASADASVEASGIFGVTRNHGNYGSVNLLAASGWESYLRFHVEGVQGTIASATLRLHGRQSGRSGGNLHLLQQNWNEHDVTWLTKPAVTAPPIGRLNAVQAGQWHAFEVESVMTGNGIFNFALIGAGEKPVSFDARESLNHQPELIVATEEAAATSPPVISNLAGGTVTSSTALIRWDTDVPASAQIEFGLDPEYSHKTAEEKDFSRKHFVTLHDLLPSKKYFLRAVARDIKGRVTRSPGIVLTTPPDSAGQVALYDVHDIYLTAANAGENPYLNGPAVTLTFTGVSGPAKGKTIAVEGFWDGDQTFCARFAPIAAGKWVWSSKSNNAGLNAKQGQLLCSGALPPSHISARGHVHQAVTSLRTLAHSAGGPFFLAGDMQASFRTQALSTRNDFEAYLAARAQQGFNFFYGMSYSASGVEAQADELNAAFYEGDSNRLNPVFWQSLDQRVAMLNQRGFVAGLPLRPAEMQAASAEQVTRFVQYLVNRYAAFNVIWVAAPEAEMETLSNGSAEFAALLAANDPYHHPFLKLEFETEEDLPASSRATTRPTLRAVIDAPEPRDDEAARKAVWRTAMAGGFCVYQEGKLMNQPTISVDMPQAEGAHVMTTLREFWNNDSHYEIRWWEFTTFVPLGNRRWLAGNPGVEYVIYAESGSGFKVDLSEAAGQIQGQWFNTKTGLWSTFFSGETGSAVALKPPAEECVAYLLVKR